MLFNSTQFILFFPIAVLLYFLFPKKVRNYWLLICSYFYYMCWNPKYILLLMASTLVTYLSGILMEHVKNSGKSDAVILRQKNWIVAASFILNIGMLFYFKYINFAIDTWERIFAKLGITMNVPAVDVVLPVGISFYIFQALSYTMDVYRDEIYAEKNPFRYALFVSFFPQLVAGPIERSKNLLKQLATPGEFNYDNVRSGLLTMLWGYFLKLVIADRCAILVDTVYNNVSGYFGYQLVLASVLFALQIYCDFMSYSTIAIGAARVLGYDLMENFHLPYFATSIKDFWRRWHISLSTWLRDYLYIPLGGNRKGQLRKYFNIMVTFFVSGLWHGAAFTYIFWGVLHGIYQIIEDLLKSHTDKLLEVLSINPKNKVLYVCKIIVTFIFVDIAWVFFRANSISDAFTVFKNSFYLANLVNIKVDLWALGLDIRNMAMLMLGTLILFISSVMRARGDKQNKTLLVEWISSKNFIIRYALYWSCMIMIIFSMDITGQEFIYFQF
ncbi:MAG: MBOAT family protein [Pseudobutyrivibrio ruminis]|uniref:MBOAT family O-acyltransferase n=1 Tax=Pseudobutyrivibrio ruminis TaxID=46206 RepID=UPI0026F2F144|nr:MBOAT family O-acyltransferase [Pseudobutyrivibrio ruminis]MBE5912938.1 MBOAT family protein [Pseudobutyrivibrio ruminis]